MEGRGVCRVERCLRLAASRWRRPIEATARERATGCKVGPIKSISELDDRVAACTLAIDSSRSPAQLALALSYRAQALLNQKKCDLAIRGSDAGQGDISPSKKSSAYYDLHLWISAYWQNCKGDFDRGIAVLNEADRDPAARSRGL